MAPLPLRVDRVEGERGLARPAQPGNHGERVSRYFDVDILEVVLARPAHRYLSNRHGLIGRNGLP